MMKKGIGGIMKRKTVLFATLAGCLFALLWLPVSGVAAVSPIAGLIQDAMKVLALEKGGEDLGVLTNARYVTLSDKTTEHYITDIENLTGASMGKGNLLFFNERPKDSLLIIVAHRSKMQCVVIRFDGTQGETKFLSLKDSDLRDSDFFWNATLGASGKETFNIVSIISAWFAGAPYEFMHCVELHGHICPGIFFGYFTSKGILEKYPLLRGEKYILIASPNECKDDAFQVLLGLTPGKQNLIVKPVDKRLIKQKAGHYATGILIKWSESKQSGLGVVLSIHFDAIKAAIKMDFGQHSSRNEKLLAARKLTEHLSEYADFFSVEKEFTVTKELKNELMRAGTNPYVLLGMMSEIKE